MSASQSGMNQGTSSGSSDNLGGLPSRRKAPIMSGAGVAIVVIVAIIAVIAGWAVGYYVVPPKSSSGSYGATVTETGSSLIYPVIDTAWGPGYMTQYPSMVISSASTGSGEGQAYAEKGLIDIGGSDAYLTNASTTNLINFPMAISSQLVYYNIPHVTANLNLNATIIAEIYLGTITTWNNALIQAANPGVTLPDNTIIPIARTDSSGDTFLITSYMYMGCKCWGSAGQTYATAKLSGTLSSSIQYASGNSGMVTALGSTSYGIAYIGISYETEAAAAGLTYAYLGDNLANSGTGGVTAANYISPTVTNISYDANLGLQKLTFTPPYTNGLAISLIMGAPAGGATDLVSGGGGTNPTTAYPTPYPDVNLEYGLVKTTGNPGGPSHAWYVVQFLQWVITIGNLPTFLAPSTFLPLTPTLLADDYTLLGLIQTSAP